MPRGNPDLSRAGVGQRRPLSADRDDPQVRQQLVEIGMALQSDIEGLNSVSHVAGFETIADSTVTYNSLTNEVTITPVSADFSYYSDGELYTESAALAVAPGALVEGLTYFYLDAGTFVAATELTGDILATKAIVAATYWDASNNYVLVFNDLRRTEVGAYRPVQLGLRMRYLQELDIVHTSINGSGALDAHAELTIDGPGEKAICYEGSRPHEFEMDLDEIPVYYRTANGWREQVAGVHHVVTTGSGRIGWNEFNGTAWVVTEVGDGKYMLMHYLFLPDPANPVICVMGINEYDGTVGEEDAAFEIDALHLNGLASLCPVWFMFGSVLWQTDNTYANTVKARLISAGAWGNYRDWRDYESIGASLINSTRAAEAAQETADDAVVDAAAAQSAADAAQADANTNATDISTNATAITNKEDHHDLLTSLAGLSLTKFDMIYAGGATSWTNFASSSVGRSILGAATAAAVRAITLAQAAHATLDLLVALTVQTYGLSLLEISDQPELHDEVQSTATRGTTFNNFMGAGSSQMLKGSSTSGSGTTVAQGWEWVNTTNNWLGAIKCETGTTSTGRAQFHTGNNLLNFGSMAYLLETVISVEALSTVSEEFTTWWGFADNVTGGTLPTRGVFFRYDRLNEGTNWQAVTRMGGTETATDTGIAVTAGFTQTGQRLKIVADADGGEIRFYIDGTLEATHTTNIPTSRLGTIGKMEKSAGTTEIGCGWNWERFSWSDTDDLD